MHCIDKIYTKQPYYGYRRMHAHVASEGYVVGEKRIRTLMKQMGLYAVYPGKKRQCLADNACIYPYRLRYVVIEKPNQVWATDITYIRLKGGFAYLIAIMDWYSRYVISWRLSPTLHTAFCLDALNDALKQPAPVFFNTDQGVQFTSIDFTQMLLDNGVRVSMAGKGRCFDNIFTERLWRSLKQENIYISDYETFEDAKAGIDTYWQIYNTERRHQSLNYLTPHDVHHGDSALRAQINPIHQFN